MIDGVTEDEKREIREKELEAPKQPEASPTRDSGEEGKSKRRSAVSKSDLVAENEALRAALVKANEEKESEAPEGKEGSQTEKLLAAALVIIGKHNEIDNSKNASVKSSPGGRVDIGPEMNKLGLESWGPRMWPTAIQVGEICAKLRERKNANDAPLFFMRPI